MNIQTPARTITEQGAPSGALPFAHLSMDELSAAFGPLFDRWRSLTISCQQEDDAFNATVETATGVKLADKPTDEADPRYAAYWQTRVRLAREGKWDCTDEAWRALNADLGPICNAILQHRPESLSDLALQAKAAAVRVHDLWTDPEATEDQSEAMMLRQLVDNICTLAGTTPPVRLAAD